jgi:hypothetical protein
MVPPRGWEVELALDDQSRQQQERRTQLIASRPDAKAPLQKVADWLRDAIDGKFKAGHAKRIDYPAR